MISPYDIEELFPDETVRFPRSQAGTAPQGWIVTLLADYTLSTRASLPSAAIVAFLADAGVSSAGARAALSRLARRGILERTKQGRHSAYSLTPAAAGKLSFGGQVMVSAATETPWDHQWTLVAFSLAQDEAARRRELRSRLRWLGFAPLYDGLWVSARDLTEHSRTQLARLSFGAMTVFQARHTDVGSRDPLQAWDTAAIHQQYESLIREWQPLLRRMQVGTIDGAEAVAVRTEVMDNYRRLPVIDPDLPLELLPPGWLRVPTRDLFVQLYDGLATPAQQYVRAVASEFTNDPLTGIQAHSVADLRSGIPTPAPNT
ncbi:phenylacetic acid degradation operon negative regulatory protein PaaX [Kribbella albertanoniae]|uniref:PaaX family transcriptional regulator n=1 Tax=Kribbella albertanoniae TaxID=1266829 RepID=A0A4R4P9K8_9ACTN|nr:PaaX family transcriptional regulator C-terminal domain-containing protein [Kribbella albertanoniae]TDC17577.1 PaaX family transcriptional regulator [Kribbella albertanoniae]